MVSSRGCVAWKRERHVSTHAAADDADADADGRTRQTAENGQQILAQHDRIRVIALLLRRCEEKQSFYSMQLQFM